MNFSWLVDGAHRAGGNKFPPLGRGIFEAFFRLLPNPCALELFPGIRADLNLADDTQKSTYWQGDRFEWPTCPILKRFCQPPVRRFFDIGSNYGFFSYYLLTECPHLDIAAFEPNPKTFFQLQEIKRRNHLAKLSLHAIGLSDVKTEKHLFQGNKDSGHSTFFRHPELHQKTPGTIPLRRFDDWLETEQIHPPSSPEWVAKIDVEGSECGVLRGMESLLGKRVFALVVIELNEFTLGLAGDSVDKVRKLLAVHGYRELDPRQFGYGHPRTANGFFVPAP